MNLAQPTHGRDMPYRRIVSKDEALAMIGALSQASIQAYQAANGQNKRSPEKAASLEIRAAQQLFKAITGEEATTTEIEEALGL